MNIASLAERIRASLEKLRPDQVIVFGSRAGAHSDADAESDLDLAVILPIDEEPTSFRERMDLVHRVRDNLRDLEREYPLDILVFTRPEWERFIRKKSWFSRELESKGRRIA